METNYTFENLLDQYEVLIPRIQREYAQGRKDVLMVRRGIVSAMVGAACKKTEPPLTLDFVYGVYKQRCGKSLFMPLDGQQRLTTLMLLYWYFGRAKKEWRFEYQSRRMAMRFVAELFKENGYDRKIPPSEWIRQKMKSFVPAWERDPTVHGMMVVLDEIYSEARSLPQTAITVEDLSRISFYVHACNDEVSHEETYLKINARGEPLTAWENIKSVLDSRTRVLVDGMSGGVSDDNAAHALIWRRSVNGEWMSRVENLLPRCPSDSLELPFYIALCVDMINAAYRNIVDAAAMTCVNNGHLNELINRKKKQLGSEFDQNVFGVSVLGAREGAESIKDVDDLRAFFIEAFKNHTATIEDYRDSLIVPDDVFKEIHVLFDAIADVDLVARCWTRDRTINALWQEQCSTDRKEQSCLIEFKRDFLFSNVHPSGGALENSGQRKRFEKWIEDYGKEFNKSKYEYQDVVRYILLSRAKGDYAFNTTRALNLLDTFSPAAWAEEFSEIITEFKRIQTKGIGNAESCCEILRSNDSSTFRKIVQGESRKEALFTEGKKSFLQIERKCKYMKGVVEFAYDANAKDYCISRIDDLKRVVGSKDVVSNVEYWKMLRNMPHQLSGKISLPQHFGLGQDAADDFIWFLLQNDVADAWNRYVRGQVCEGPCWVSEYKTLLMKRKCICTKLECHDCKWGGSPRFFMCNGTDRMSKNAICVEYSAREKELLCEKLGDYFVNFDRTSAYDDDSWMEVRKIMGKVL